MLRQLAKRFHRVAYSGIQLLFFALEIRFEARCCSLDSALRGLGLVLHIVSHAVHLFQSPDHLAFFLNVAYMEVFANKRAKARLAHTEIFEHDATAVFALKTQLLYWSSVVWFQKIPIAQNIHGFSVDVVARPSTARNAMKINLLHACACAWQVLCVVQYALLK